MKLRSLVQLAAPTVAVVGLWFVLAWMPSHGASAQARRDQAESELVLLTTEIEDARALGAVEDELDREIAVAASAVPAEPAVAPFVRAAHVAATESDVRIDQIAPLAVSSDSDPESPLPLPSHTSSVAVSIGATGSYPALMTFVDALTGSDRLVVVDSIELRTDEADPTIVTLDVELRIFTTAELVAVPELDDELEPVDEEVS